jgi:26S proteasome regulatory subunit N10
MTALRTSSRAVVILLDNTSSSIDGDFFPTRLEAQKLTVERYAQFLFGLDSMSQIAISTLSSTQYGVRASFTNSCTRLARVVPLISASPGILQLVNGIQWAVLALKHSRSDILIKRIIAFVGAAHDVLTFGIASEISDLLSSANVFLDIVVLGKDVEHVSALRRMIPPRLSRECTFLEVPESATVLSDNVLASPIGAGDRPKPNFGEYTLSDLTAALSMSMTERAEKAPAFLGGLLAAPVPRQARTPRIARVRKPRKAETDAPPGTDPSGPSDDK